MVSNGYKKAFDGILKSYVSLDESAETIVRQLKKTPNTDTRWLGRGQAPYSVGSAYLLLPVSSGSASLAEP
jgi:hypothetical protein